MLLMRGVWQNQRVKLNRFNKYLYYLHTGENENVSAKFSIIAKYNSINMYLYTCWERFIAMQEYQTRPSEIELCASFVAIIILII